jgi:hypothetical protein
MNQACVSRTCRFCMPSNTFHHGSSVDALSSIERPMRLRPLASSLLLRAAALVITLLQRCTCTCRFGRYITYFPHAIWIGIHALLGQVLTALHEGARCPDQDSVASKPFENPSKGHAVAMSRTCETAAPSSIALIVSMAYIAPCMRHHRGNHIAHPAMAWRGQA